MRTWMLAAIETPCGACPTTVAVGKPLLVLQFVGHLKKKYRCQACAGEPVPDGITARSVPLSPSSPVDLTRVGLLPLAFGHRGREPGEEG